MDMAKIIFSFLSFFISLHCIVAIRTLENFNNNIEVKKIKCNCVVDKIGAFTEVLDELYGNILNEGDISDGRNDLNFEGNNVFIGRLKSECEDCGEGSTNQNLGTKLKARLDKYEVLFQARYTGSSPDNDVAYVSFTSQITQATNNYKTSVPENCGIDEIPASAELNALSTRHNRTANYDRRRG